MIFVFLMAYSYTQGDFADIALTGKVTTCTTSSDPACELFNSSLAIGEESIGEANMFVGPKIDFLLSVRSKLLYFEITATDHGLPFPFPALRVRLAPVIHCVCATTRHSLLMRAASARRSAATVAKILAKRAPAMVCLIHLLPWLPVVFFFLPSPVSFKVAVR